jgi:hypothetical protein
VDGVLELALRTLRGTVAVMSDHQSMLRWGRKATVERRASQIARMAALIKHGLCIKPYE